MIKILNLNYYKITNKEQNNKVCDNDIINFLIG